jgi:O-antigen ligase
MLTFTEWSSNSRKFFVGRGVHAFTDRDLLVLKYGDVYSKMNFAVRRGATHNIVTDLLITVGLVGTILYVLVFIGFIVSMIKILKIAKDSKNITYDTVFVCLLFCVSMIPPYILGGGGVYNTVALVFSATIANLAVLSPFALEPQRAVS